MFKFGSFASDHEIIARFSGHVFISIIKCMGSFVKRTGMKIIQQPFLCNLIKSSHFVNYILYLANVLRFF